MQRIAYPSAVEGIDRAQSLFDRALRLHDLDPERKNALANAAAEHRDALNAAADAIEAIIDEYAKAEGAAPQAEAKSAAIYSWIEHKMFLKDELCDAAIVRARPHLSATQVTNIAR